VPWVPSNMWPTTAPRGPAGGQAES
jgi:hypothetical protein